MTLDTTMHDRQSFDATVRPLLDNLYGAAMRLTRDPANAEDLVQDTVLRAWKFRDTFESGTNAKAWLFTILRNTFINGWHKAARRQSFDSAMEQERKAVGDEAAIGGSCSSPASPEAVVFAGIDCAAVRSAIASLPPDFRQCVTLCDIEGFSYKEIAAMTEAPIGTVMSRIYRGRKALAKALGAPETSGQLQMFRAA